MNALQRFADNGGRPSDTSDTADADRLQRVRTLIRERERRQDYFDVATLFGEPAWDVLLRVYGDTLAGRATPLATCIAASGAGPETARRYVTLLMRRGLLVDAGDEDGTPRVILSQATERSMRDYIDDIRR